MRWLISRLAHFVAASLASLEASNGARIEPMARGYAEGPASEERFEALERGDSLVGTRPPQRAALYGATPDDPEQHFIGWADELDPDALFDAGKAWGLKVVRRSAG